MKRKYFTLFPIIFLLVHNVSAQESIPLLTGNVNLSIEKGTIECNLTLSHIPRINDYYIRINAGMNISHLKLPDTNNLIRFERSFNDTLSTGESKAYFIPDSTGKGKLLPRVIQFKYAGQYRVFTDTMKNNRHADWKGHIAFNGYSVRTDGYQSAWYPVLYDIKEDREYYKIKYDIRINCSDCNTLYINGSLPVKGTEAHFKSDIPRELTMYCGRYKVADINGMYLLNTNITRSQMEELGKITGSYKQFYAEHLNIPYKGSIVYIQTSPTSGRKTFAFSTTPTIVNVSYGKYSLKGLFDKKNIDLLKQVVAHELAHYYFGAYRLFNSDLSDMLREGFSEYLSLKVTKELIGDSSYIKRLNGKFYLLRNFIPIPFAKIKSRSDYKNRRLYVYNYAPIIFMAIEKEIGEKNMWKWLEAILKTKIGFTNYSFLEQTLSSVLQDKKKLALIKSKYFYSKNSIENARNTIISSRTAGSLTTGSIK